MDPSQGQAAQQSQTPTVTNIFRKVENVFVTNSIDTQVYQPDFHKSKCSVHEDRSVDFLCVYCDEHICQLCKLSEHEKHETKSISLAAGEAKRILMSTCSSRIKQHEQTVKNKVKETRAQMQLIVHAECTTREKMNERFSHLQCLIGIDSSESRALLAKTFEERLHSAQKKMQRLKRKGISLSELNFEESMSAIRLRQAVLHEMINRRQEQTLAQLSTMTTESCTELEVCVKSMEEELADIARLRERIEAVIKENDHTNILNLRRQVMVEFSAERLRCRLRSMSPVFTYTLHHEADKDIDENDVISDIFWNDQKDVVESYIQSFLGHAVKNGTPARKAVEDMAIQVKPAFHCNEDSQTVVKSMCPRGDQQIVVSFSAHPNEGRGWTKSFDVNGNEMEVNHFGLGTLKTISNSHGRLSVHFLPSELVNLFEPASAAGSSLFAKHEKYYILRSSSESSGYCHTFYIIYLDETGTIRETYLGRCLNVAAFTTTAFDASRSGESFAVVDVLLHEIYNAHGFLDGVRFDRELFILDRTYDGSFESYKYEPPTPKFCPTDVCFFDLNGEDVLAIADMGTNAIHLACRCGDSGKFSFSRYLLEDHPLLNCPTALNTDPRGWLWVACKGGLLLVLEMVFGAGVTVM